MSSELLIALGLGLVALSGCGPTWWHKRYHPKRKRVDLSHIMANFLKPQIEGPKGRKERR